MSLRFSLGGGVVCALLAVSCGGGDKPSGLTEADVVRQYAVNLRANYQDVVGKLQDLQSAVDAFVGAPSQEGFDAARAAWLAARPGYGQCEVSRFYGGPLDEAQGRMNEWPIDENFLDYTYDIPAGGIVNQPAAYPVIDVDVLKSTDHMGGLENLPAGFHAIEFLLWGQRPSQADGPGARPYTDYVDGGTAANQSRRRDYLKAATDLLLSDMQGLVAAWDLSDPNSYGAAMVAGSAHDGVQKIARGLTDMHISELYYERLLDPYVTMDRKDEESCFSESTYTDLVANATGVADTYHGRYGSLAGRVHRGPAGRDRSGAGRPDRPADPGHVARRPGHSAALRSHRDLRRDVGRPQEARRRGADLLADAGPLSADGERRSAS